MRATLHGLVLAAAVTAAASGASAQPSARAQATAAAPSHQQTLTDYCVGCHNDRLRTGGFSLERADLHAVAAQPEVWEKVVRKLRLGVMPPQGARRPEPAVLDAVATSLEADLDAAAAARPNPGRPA